MYGSSISGSAVQAVPITCEAQFAAPPGKPVILLLGGTLLQEASIETLQPEPQVSRSHGEALLLELGTSEDGVATLYLTLRSDYVGTLEGSVRAGPSSAVHFTSFLYP